MGAPGSVSVVPNSAATNSHLPRMDALSIFVTAASKRLPLAGAPAVGFKVAPVTFDESSSRHKEPWPPHGE